LFTYFGDSTLDEEIDQETYRRRAEVLRREIADTERELRSTEAGFLDLEGVLAFARKIVTSPARLWMESSLNQRQRLQKAFFPDGLVYGKCGFGIAPISSFSAFWVGLLTANLVWRPRRN
jgi:hypothetical protein